MEIFFLALILALIPAMIAKKKDQSFVPWYFYGLFLFIIALVHAILITPKNMKKCPRCSEMIKYDAKVCRYCNNDFS